MDTHEARLTMRDLAQDALEIVERLKTGSMVTASDRLRLRRASAEARSTLSDAGFPGEAAWRGLQRANIGADTSGDQTDPLFWQDVVEELRGAIETLEALVSPGLRREADFNIVG